MMLRMLLAVAMLGATALTWAAAPPVPWTKAQKAKWAERDRLEKSLQGLSQQKKYDDLIAAMKQIAQLGREVLGEADPDVVGEYDRVARWHEALGQFAEAAKVRQYMLRVQAAKWGQGHWEVTNARLALEDAERVGMMTANQRDKLRQAQAWEQQAIRLRGQGKPKEALAPAAKVRELREEVLGKRHPDYASSLNYLGLLHKDLGQYPKALPLYQESLTIREKALGKRHPSYAMSLNNLGMLHLSAGVNDLALPLLQEALEIREEVLGKRHPDYANSLNNLALLCVSMGQAHKALFLYQDALALREEVLGKRHEDYAGSLNNLAMLYQILGKPAKALPLYQEALAVQELTLTKRHPDYATTLNNLAACYQSLGDYILALPLYKEVLALRGEILGKRHPLQANSLNNLAELYLDRGECAKALPLYKEALAIREEALGKWHNDYVTSLNNLARVYRSMGEDAQALPLLELALAIRERVLGKSHPHYALSLNNLALLHHHTGEYSQALSRFKEVLAITEKEPGKKHPNYAAVLHNLSALYQSRGEDAKALSLCNDALAIREQALGKRHPDYAESLNSLALLSVRMGKNDQALQLIKEAVAIREQTLGKRHPLYADTLNNLAGVYQRMGDPKEAVKCSAQAVEVLERHLDDAFELLGERQRNQVLQNVLHHLGGLLSHQEQAGASAAERYAVVLAWKGRVAEFSALDQIAADRPELKQTLVELKSARRRLASLTLRTPKATDQAAWLADVQSLTERKEALEAELARLCSEVRARNQLLKLTPARLAKQLSDGVAFIDIVEYDHQTIPKDGKGRNTAELRLLAFVSRRDKEVVAVPLGVAAAVSDAVASWRAEIEKEPTKADRKAIASAAALLRQKVWDILVPHLGDATTVVIAPDGALCQFPLAALPGTKLGTYLIEERAITQVASGAQLFGLLEPVGKDAKTGKGLVVVGGIDYGTEPVPYGALPGTGREARLCRDLFRAFSGEYTKLLEGKNVTPATLLQEMALRPKYLHLATHGYFEPADKVERLLKGLATQQNRDLLHRQQRLTLSNLPGLRCGLALSGANAGPPAGDPDALPNVLTGDHLAHMDLRGCELAVLSACQTALGDVKRSQGVLGLQRAFHAAGVRTTVTSMWCVQDAATAELMEEFYKRLWGKEKISRIEALRQAQLTILRDPERVRKRSAALLAEAEKRGLPEDVLRGIKGRLASDLPDGGKPDESKKPKTSPEAWWAAFVLSGDWR